MGTIASRILGKRTFEKDIDRIDTSIFSGDLPPGPIGTAAWNHIHLIPPNGATVTSYPVTIAGLLAALTAATVAGSMIWVPPGTFNTSITIPANIALVALGEKVSINGQWTLNSGVVVANIVQTQSGSSAGALSGVVGPSSGIAYMKNCSINVENSGAGDAYAVNQSAAGDLWLWGCATYGNASGGGSGFGVRQSAGNVYTTRDGRHRGSTGKFSGTVQLFDIDDVIHLKTSTFTKLFNATDAGLTAALAAASSGDTVRLPDRCSISGGPWTNPAGVTIKGTYNSVLTGAITNNGICESFRVVGNVTNAGVWLKMRSTVSTGTGITQSSSAGFMYRPIVSIGTGATYGINITAGYLFHGITENQGGSTNIGILANGATVEIYHSRFGGAAAGGQVETARLVSNCLFAGDGDVSVNGDGLRHTTGTANISNSRFRNGGTGTGFGLNVTAAGLTLTDCNWDSVNAGGLANVTFGDGDRGAWDAVNFTAKHSKDLNDETYEHHWPLSNLDATTAPTAGDDSGDGYDVGSVWVDVTNDNVYICVDATVGSAVWASAAAAFGEGISAIDEFWKVGNNEVDNPVIPLGTGADSDLFIREIGNVLYEPSESSARYKIYYTGYNAGVSTDEKIHYAYSEDGINWTKYASNPVISGRRAEDPYVVKNGSTYYLYAEDKEAGGDNKIRRWSSADGETWSDDGQCTGLSDGASPVVWIEGATWYMLYEGYPTPTPYAVNLATSSDGLAWTNEATNPVFEVTDTLDNWADVGVVCDDIVKIGEVYHMLYHGQTSGIGSQFGMARSRDLLSWTDYDASPIPSDESTTAIPTACIFFDTRYTFMYYLDDSSGIYRGYPIAATAGGDVDVGTPTSGYWEPAVISAGEELIWTDNGDIAMVWIV